MCTIKDVTSEHSNLDDTTKSKLNNVLLPFESPFNKRLGAHTCNLLYFCLKEGAMLQCQNPHPISTKHMPLVKEDVNRLVSLGILELTRHATSLAPCFA